MFDQRSVLEPGFGCEEKSAHKARPFLDMAGACCGYTSCLHRLGPGCPGLGRVWPTAGLVGPGPPEARAARGSGPRFPGPGLPGPGPFLTV